MITESAINAAIKRVTQTKKPETLKEDGPRGSGRLTLQIRAGATRIAAEWYAVWYVGAARKQKKLEPDGNFPTMSVKEARQVFSEEYAPKIRRGESPGSTRAGRRAPAEPDRTFGALCEAYVAELERQGKPAAYGVRHYLLGSKNKPTRGTKKILAAVDVIGRDTPLASITKFTILPYLKEFKSRGSLSAAYSARAYLSAMFNFALGDDQVSYLQEGSCTDWGVTSNPVKKIKRDDTARVAGERLLTPTEFRLFWEWLDANLAAFNAAPAAMVEMAMGQRPGEISRLTRDATAPARFPRAERIKSDNRQTSLGFYDANAQTMYWSITKASKPGKPRPHHVPVCRQAADVLERIPKTKNVYGLIFPGRDSSAEVISASAWTNLMRAFFKDQPKVRRFSARDLRRTWKTLAGRAGISKEDRDRLQNHIEQDISTKHYDRYNYWPEKVAAMKVWEGFLDRILAGEFEDEAEVKEAA